MCFPYVRFLFVFPCVNSLFPSLAFLLIETLVFYIYIYSFLNSTFALLVCFCLFLNMASSHLSAPSRLPWNSWPRQLCWLASTGWGTAWYLLLPFCLLRSCSSWFKWNKFSPLLVLSPFIPTKLQKTKTSLTSFSWFPLFPDNHLEQNSVHSDKNVKFGTWREDL